jgi:hypothetical protein
MDWKELSERYIQKGLSVIPVRGKTPLIRGWQKWCYEQQEEAITSQFQTGIGLCCGPASGIVCVDIDTDDDEILSKVPPSPIVRRGKKGEVRFYSYTKEIESRNYHKHKVEVLSAGRQVVLPPSIHPDTGQTYTWVRDDLLTFNLSYLPTLDLNFLKDLKVFGAHEATYGRNNKLKDIAVACLCSGKSFDDTVEEVYQYDKECHSPRLFTDGSEGYHAEGESGALKNAMLFVNSIQRSLIKSAVLKGKLTSLLSPEVQVEEVSAPSPKKSEILNIPMPDGHLLDLFGLIKESSYTDAPNLALGSAISIFTTMMGSNYTFEGVAPNIFSLLAADSGTGKSFGIKVATKLLGPHGLIGSADYVSTQVFCELSDYQVRLDLNEEFSKFLKLTSSSNPWQSAMPQELIKLWSASVDDYLLPVSKSMRASNSPLVIQKPHISLLVATTLSELKKSMSASAFSSGFLPRFLIFVDESVGVPRSRLDFKKIDEMTAYLKAVVRNMLKVKSGAGEVSGFVKAGALSLAPSAEIPFENYMVGLHLLVKESQNELLTHYLTRGREHFKKLAMIHAVSCGRGVVSIEDLEWADAVFRVSAKNLEAFFLREASAETVHQSMKERVFTIISQNPGISGNELARKTQFVRKRERQEIIDDLLEAKRIVRIEKGHGYCYAVKE